MSITPYRKAIVAVGAAVGELVAVTADGDLTTNEGIAVALALLGAAGVYQVANKAADPA